MISRIVWKNSEGVEFPFTSSTGVRPAADTVEGIDEFPVSIASQPVVGVEGSRFEDLEVGPREVDIGLVVEGARGGDHRDTLRRLSHAVSPLMGEGELIVRDGHGDRRVLYCRPEGISAPIDNRNYTHTARKVVASFTALRPYWHSARETSFTFDQRGFFPILPLRLGAVDSEEQSVVTNNGDVHAWPVWEIRGSGTVEIKNLTTGEDTEIDYMLTEGDVLTVDTRPGEKSVRNSAGDNLYSTLSNPILWPISRGEQTISVLFDSGDPNVGTRVQLSFQERWLTA